MTIKNQSGFAYLLLTMLLIFAIYATNTISAEESGGSDEHIEIDVDAGGSGEFNWNETHGFAIEEDGEKIDDKFNVTICEDLKWDSPEERYKPSGYIFGELHGIYWDDSPAPAILILKEDFGKYKTDENNLSVYTYGEYEGPKGIRYAYKRMNITKPNHAPLPMARVAAEGIWNWIDVKQTCNVTFIIESGDQITLWFNGSDSWDVDDEEVTDWKWDLDGDGKFGHSAWEQGVNRSKVLTTGKSYRLGLIVIDERGKGSIILDFIIRVPPPILKPDLTPIDISCENQDSGKQDYDEGDTIVISSLVKNIGDNNTASPFDVLFEYSRDDGATYTYLANITVQDYLSPNGFRHLTWLWDTSLEELTPGNYSIRVTVDSNDDIREESEDNNTNTLVIHLKDNISPTITITFPENGAVVNGT
ncbi:MAG: hypothetical protein KAU14_10230, partial [Thermoplasmata archaeon]|nr:hypothetical protein [Thermoplasmata archaeon]